MTNTNRINRYASPFWADLDQFFQRPLTRKTSPQKTHNFHVTESEEAWSLRTDLPGFSKKDVELAVEKGVLKVTATAGEDNPGFAAGFEQGLQLPREVDRSKISAQLTKGVLEITLPRLPKEEDQTLRIDVN
jgi:HSP20 family protein